MYLFITAYCPSTKFETMHRSEVVLGHNTCIDYSNQKHFEINQ